MNRLSAKAAMPQMRVMVESGRRPVDRIEGAK